MMEFIVIYGVIAMTMVVVLGNYAIVEDFNKVGTQFKRINGAGSKVVVRNVITVNEMGVDFGKLKQ